MSPIWLETRSKVTPKSHDDVAYLHHPPSSNLLHHIVSEIYPKQDPSKNFGVLQTFNRKRFSKVKNDGYENHL